MISFKEEADGTISVFHYDTKIMRIGKKEGDYVKTRIFNSFETIVLSSVEDTKSFILEMYSHKK